MLSFNAVADKWILVSNKSGVSEVSIQDIFDPLSEAVSFTEGAWKGLAPLRLLVAIATAAHRPQTNADIVGYLEDLPSFCSIIQDYLAQWEGSFDLFSATKPFLQVAFMDTSYPMEDKMPKGYKGYKRTPTTDLITEGFKTATIRTGSVVDPLASLSSLMRALLYAQVLGANKKYGVHNNTPYVKLHPQGDTLSMQSSFSSSISTNGGSTSTLNIHMYDGGSLIKTIIYNMIAEENIKESIWSLGFGKPIWEYDVWDDHTKFLQVSSDISFSFLGRLVPILKFLWIDPERPTEMVYSCSEGIDYLGALETLKSSMKYDTSYYLPPQNKKGKALLGTCRDSSHLWREFSSLNINTDIPLVMTKFKSIQKYTTIQSTAVSMLCSSSMGLVYCEDVIVSSVNWSNDVFRGYLTGSLSISSFAEYADTVSSKLYSALYVFNREMGCTDNNRGESNKSTVMNYYWYGVNGGFQYYFDRSSSPTIMDEWKAFINDAAKRALYSLRDNNMRCNISLVKAEHSL